MRTDGAGDLIEVPGSKITASSCVGIKVDDRVVTEGLGRGLMYS